MPQPSNFLYATGADGFLATPFSLLTTELNTLGNSNTTLSSVNGATSNGIFTQTDTSSGVWAQISFLSGGAFTPSAASPSILGWFTTKADDSHFEKTVTNTSQPRSPDFIIPLFVAAYALNDLALCLGGIVRLPSSAFKVLVSNGSGVSLPATGNKIMCGPVAVAH